MIKMQKKKKNESTETSIVPKENQQAMTIHEYICHLSHLPPQRCPLPLSGLYSCRPFACIFCIHIREIMGLPWGLSSKESTCQSRRCGFSPWGGKIPWRRKWQPTPVFLPGKSHGQKSLVGYSPGGC